MSAQDDPPPGATRRKAFRPGELNRLIQEAGLPVREGDTSILIAHEGPRPWPKATQEELISLQERCRPHGDEG